MRPLRQFARCDEHALWFDTEEWKRCPVCDGQAGNVPLIFGMFLAMLAAIVLIATLLG